jgi:L-ascorbate metabolism protein UlaG (beta-lactamase superfamily)
MWECVAPEDAYREVAKNTSSLAVRYLGGPTALVEIGGVRLLTDPTFDPPGDHPIGNRVLVKTGEPVVSPAQLGRVDAVLLSHDQHPDNLDNLGRDYVATAPLVLSTPPAAARLGTGVRALKTGTSTDVSGASGGAVGVTSVPARHGPPGCEPVVGDVTGFAITCICSPPANASSSSR